MPGLDAITAQNGWAMALTGACIVMTGLAVLAFIISQLHRIVSLFEKKHVPVETPAPETSDPASEPISGPENILDDLATAAKLYMPLTAGLGDTFKLSSLYQIFEKEKLPHPHITIRALRDAGYLASAGEGSFFWKNV